MIKANELRIGNWVNYNINGEQLHSGKITGIYNTQDEPSRGVIDYHYPLVFGQPIPLTPEILEKAGFESVRWSMGSYNWVHRESKICFKRLKTQGDVVRFMAHNRITHVTSLHQLQNLYFALTGEELNINL